MLGSSGFRRRARARGASSAAVRRPASRSRIASSTWAYQSFGARSSARRKATPARSRSPRRRASTPATRSGSTLRTLSRRARSSRSNASAGSVPPAADRGLDVPRRQPGQCKRDRTLRRGRRLREPRRPAMAVARRPARIGSARRQASRKPQHGEGRGGESRDLPEPVDRSVGEPVRERDEARGGEGRAGRIDPAAPKSGRRPRRRGSRRRARSPRARSGRGASTRCCADTAAPRDHAARARNRPRSCRLPRPGPACSRTRVQRRATGRSGRS